MLVGFLRLTASLGLLLLMAIVSLATWTRVEVQDDPARVLGVYPGHASALTQTAEALRQDNAPPETVAAVGRRLLQAAPLSEAPLVYAASAWSRSGDTESARKAYKLALARQPRNVPALTNLAAAEIEDGQYDLAIDALLRLSRLNRTSEQVYVATLVSIAQEAEGQAPFEAALAEGAPLAQQALRELNSTSTDMPLLLRLNAYEPSRAGPIVARVMESQGPEMAFIAWLSLLPSSEGRGFRWPYDGAFVGLTAPPPFNWSLSRDAEIQRQGGLFVRMPATGGAGKRFARQTVLLGPGTYDFQVDMDGEVKQDGAHFEWSIQCLSSGAPLARIKIDTLDMVMANRSVQFVVPDASCSAQEVVLTGLPGLYPVGARAIVRRVTLEKAAGLE